MLLISLVTTLLSVSYTHLSGINVGTIRKYELGIRNPKPDQLEKIATALGLNAVSYTHLMKNPHSNINYQ